MGEMPKLGPDPWSLMQAFQHANAVRSLAGPRGRQTVQNVQQNNVGESEADLAAQDARDDAEADAADGSGPPLPPTRPVSSPVQFRPLISKAAMDAGVDLPIFTRLVKAESGFNPNAVSPTGAKGLTQLMPGTAKMLGVDPNDPEQNLAGGARYLAQQEKMFGPAAGGNDGRALAAYNWGPGNVKKWIANGADPSKAPAETQNYVRKITGRPLAMNEPSEEDKGDPDKTDPASRLSWLA